MIVDDYYSNISLKGREEEIMKAFNMLEKAERASAYMLILDKVYTTKGDKNTFVYKLFNEKKSELLEIKKHQDDINKKWGC